MTFDYMSWEAAATFVAVVGASVVGWRQVGIARQQANIQAEQAAIDARLASIEELKLRSEQFDRRMSVYHAADAWMSWIMTRGTIPGKESRALRAVNITRKNPIPIPGTEEREDYIRAMNLSRFIFRPAVYGALLKAWNHAEDWIDAARSEASSRQEVIARQAKMDEARKEIRELQDILFDIFNPELNLSDVGAGR